MPPRRIFRFIPYRHFVPLPPKEEAKTHVILNDSEESHRRTDGYILYHFGCGIFRLRSI